MGVLGTDGQRLFHHHGNTSSRADFHHPPVVVGVRIRQNSLWVRLLQHVFQVAEHQVPVEAKLGCVSRCELLIRLGDPHNVDVGPMQRALEKALGVSVNQSRDSDTERFTPDGSLRVSSRKGYE